MCERWESFANFIADMGQRPAGMTSLDRLDNDGDYEPGNCRWTTQREQVRNQRITRRVAIGGATYLAVELAERSGLKTDTIMERAAAGLTLEEILAPEKRVFTEGLALGGLANGARQRAKTHCSHGHPYDATNTMLSPEGWRRCRACHNAKQRRLNAAKRE